MSFVSFIRSHPIASYFVVAFSISWILAFLVVSSVILRGQPLSYGEGIFMFPLMIIGPCLSGLMFTRIVDGKTGFKELIGRMRAWKVRLWYIPAILLPPLLILTVLLVLSSAVSRVFVPNFFVFGIGFGVLAGFLEEIGWTGYAIRKLNMRYSPLGSAIILGALWGLWHAPVIDYLGAAYPHGTYLIPFYLSFVALVMAVRVLIVWIYSNTKSVLITQVTHASSTGSLALLAPAMVSSAQEAAWYALYAATFWTLVIVVAKRYGKHLFREPLGQPK